jgi:general secretion pathway protein D
LARAPRIPQDTSLPVTNNSNMQRPFPHNGADMRLKSMALRFLVFLCVAFVAAAAPSGTAIAKRLAERARTARDAGEVVRAYLLYNEAARRDPSISSYAASRDGLAPAANLLMKTQLEDPVVAADIARVEKEETDADIAANPPPLGTEELQRSLASYPHVQPSSTSRDFNIHGDEISLIQQVTAAYGVRAAWDPQLDPKNNLQMQITQADFRTALEALTLVTNTFVFPISNNTLYFARDSETKRGELEPVILLSLPLPESMTEKDLIDVANQVRGLLSLRQFGWDSASRTVFIRDRVSKALAARSLLEALLLPKAQVELEVEVITMDSDTNYHYGISPPTSATFLNFAGFNLSNALSSVGSFTHFFTFGGGLSLFGLGIGEASLFASYSKSMSKTRYDSITVTTDGQPASVHFGSKYPIPQTLYTGFAQSTASIYNPVPQIQEEDLGLALKMTPHVNGEGDVSIDVDAEFKSLGTFTLNTVPSVNQRKFTGNVVLHEGEWAVLAGLDQDSINRSHDGLAGLTDVPGLNQVLSENMRDKTTSQTLILIKPRVTRLPMSATTSPQYLLGPVRGFKVLL